MMKSANALLAGGIVCLGFATGTGLAQRAQKPTGVMAPDVASIVAATAAPAPASSSAPTPASSRRLASASQQANIALGRYCFRCHNDRQLTGGLTLESFDVGAAAEQAATAEKILRKLRAGMMPPANAERPPSEAYELVIGEIERRVDAAAMSAIPPGRTFQRLNRAEYERSVRDLVGLDIDAAAFLPPDTVSAGFDNIADVQGLSATVMDGYLRAAAEVSRLAVGDPDAAPRETTYEVSRYASQREHVEGAPFGTRGGISVVHNFIADGDYVFRLSFQHESTGNLFGNGRGALHTAEAPEQIEVSVDGVRVALMDVDRWGHRQEATSVEIETEPIFVRAGPQRVSAAFLRRFEGPVEDLVAPHDWSLADKKIGYSYGVTTLPHLRDFVVGGPYDPTGVSDTPSRRGIFTCRPTTADEQTECAAEIIDRLATRAYRRPLADGELAGLLAFYSSAAVEGGFEKGIATTLQAVLASPDFIFRFEEPLGGIAADGSYRIDDLDIASRLSFFLWASAPDAELVEVARRRGLRDPAILEEQVRRMLADPRAEALGSRFAAQWFRLQDLDQVHPDSLRFPDFHQQLADSMRRETELFFEHLVRADRGALELLTADYTFVNEVLARHYGIPGVIGSEFRRVDQVDDARRGILGHGSILTLTSHANRTSPVLRGKWVLEVLLGTPPPPPPPDVPDLDETPAVGAARQLSVREQMELHRANPACSSCHVMIDPVGLALENFDVTGAWRIRDRGVPIDPTGELYDGRALNGPADLRDALLGYSDAVLTTFTENLFAYAMGRRVEPEDMPQIRAILRAARDADYRMSSFVLGIANSPAFQTNRQQAPTSANTPGQPNR